jgi:homoserine O-acetyltransferase
MTTPTAPAPTLAADSVGTVETRYLELPDPLRLGYGRNRAHVRVAYEKYGALTPA